MYVKIYRHLYSFHRTRESVNQFLPVLVLCKLLLAVYLESRRMEVYRLIGHEVVLRLTKRHQASRTVSVGSLPAP